MSIVLNHVAYTYMPGTPFARQAIKDVSLEIGRGEFVGIIGHTGSGKSTLLQHFNGLLKPSAGSVTVNGQNINVSCAAAHAARRKVGMVFQYPEQQLFEETIYEDIAFGPRNLELPEKEVEKRVKRAMEFVGLDYEKFAQRSPLQLSGGQMRRVAVAGVIALEPEYLILDEPSAGLDPKGRDEIFSQIVKLHESTGITVVLVTHNMEDVARMAKRLLVMSNGTVCLDGAPGEIFRNCQAELQAAGVDVPPLTALLNKLSAKGLQVDTAAVAMEAAANSVLKALKGGKLC